MSLTVRHRLRLGVLFVVLSAAPSALAQPSAAPLSESLKGDAKDAYTSARILLNNNDFTGALSKYKEAYARSSDPRLLYDMAICEKNLKHYARMAADLQEYERHAGPTLTGDEKQIVEDALAATKNLVGALRLTVSEPGASVTIDGETVGTTPLTSPVVLDLGAHKIAVTKEGFASTDKVVQIAGGGESAAEVILTPTAPKANTSHLLVSADPRSSIAIDGQLVAAGRFEGDEKPGPHEVVVTETGMRTYKAEVDLREGERRTMQVSLEPDRNGPVLWPWIVGGAALAAGAVVGGYFLFKPSDTTHPVPPGTFASATFASWMP